MLQRWITSALICAAAALAMPAAQAQPYPNRPIRVVVTFPPGGSADILARALQPRLEELLGQKLVIENRPGAGGNIGMNEVAKAARDGYTIGIGAAGALAVNPSLYESMPFDPARDLAPVTMIAEIPFVLAVAPDLPVRSLDDMIALGRSKPAELSIAHGGNGTAMHLTAALFNQMAGLAIRLVPYRGTAPAATDLMGGHVPAAVLDIPSAAPLAEARKIRLLAVSTAGRVSFLPDVPTMAERGLAGYESAGWFGLVAPAGTPDEIITRLNGAFVEAMRDPPVIERIRVLGAEPTTSTPAAFGEFIRTERAKWAKVVSDTRVKLD